MSKKLAETREDVMLAPDLFVLLCERTAAEYQARWEKGYMQPPIGGIVLTLLLALVMTWFRQNSLATIFYIFTAIQVVWTVAVVVIRVMSDSGAIQQKILSGSIPNECADVVFRRLRWWNHLIVPLNWARHSRIHERKYKLEKKIHGLQEHLYHLQEEERKTQSKLEDLPDDKVLSIAAKINTMAERRDYESRVSEIEEEIPRRIEEIGLYKALLMKVMEVTNKLDDVERLGMVAYENTVDLQATAIDATNVLEQRRALVREVDQIEPGEFLDLVRV